MSLHITRAIFRLHAKANPGNMLTLEYADGSSRSSEILRTRYNAPTFTAGLRDGTEISFNVGWCTNCPGGYIVDAIQ